MVIVPKAFPMEFRRDVVAVARKGDATLSQIAVDFGISESCLHRWLKLADVEEGVRPGIWLACGRHIGPRGWRRHWVEGDGGRRIDCESGEAHALDADAGGGP